VARTRHQDNRLFLDAQFPSPGRYHLSLFDKRASDPGYYNQVVEYLIEVKKGAGETAGYPKTSGAFQTFGLELVSHQRPIILASGNLTVTLKAPQDVYLLSTLMLGDRELDRELVAVSRNGGLVDIRANLPAKGVYRLMIFARRGSPQGSYSYVMEYEVRAS
jgi:hypothetical protein